MVTLLSLFDSFFAIEGFSVVSCLLELLTLLQIAQLVVRQKQITSAIVGGVGIRGRCILLRNELHKTLRIPQCLSL